MEGWRYGCWRRYVPHMTALRDIELTTITGEATTLGATGGDVTLVVNVASKCGLTPQYSALEELHRRFAGRGFSVCGFPANDFAGQEPGTEAEIAEFCSVTYDVTFPMFAKVVATGEGRHPLYSELIAQQPVAAGDPESYRERLRGFGLTPTEAPEVLWNFEKFLIGRDGSVVARFAPRVTPDDPMVISAIEAALSA